MWVRMATSKAWETAEEGASGANSTPPTAGAEIWVQFLQTPEGADGIWWQWEHGSIYWVGVGWRIWGNVIQFPSRAHTDPPTLILPLLTQSSAASPSPTAALPPIVSWPI